MLYFILLLSGCSAMHEQEVKSLVTPAVQDSSNEQVASESFQIQHLETEKKYLAESGINVCRKELNILKRIDNAHYNARKTVFDKLMSGAKLYGDVRADIQNGARSTVDALFAYKVEKLCADISQDVLNGLSRIGEGLVANNKFAHFSLSAKRVF